MGTCITIFIENIIKEKIYIIIDNHKEPENVVILQDLFLNIILLEKDKIYSKFLNPNSTNTISIDIFKSKITEILNEKKKILNEKNTLIKSINSLKQHNDKNIEIITNLQTQNKKQQSEIKQLKDLNLNLTSEIKQLKDELIQKTKIVHIKETPPKIETSKLKKTNLKKKESDINNLSIINSATNSDIESDNEAIFQENYDD